MTGLDGHDEVAGSRTFQVSASAYDDYMGRYANRLAAPFGDLCLPATEGRFLDVGCGPGALTTVAVARLGSGRVAAVDPTEAFVEACRARHPGVDVRRARAEDLPFDDDEFDAAAAQLVLHFVSDADRAVAEMRRVVRPGGVVAAAVWDFAEGMGMLRAFWDAALSVDPAAPDQARTLRFGRAGELCDLFTTAGLQDVTEDTLTAGTTYADFDDLWRGLLAGVGPAGSYAVSLPPADRERLREALADRLGRPTGPFDLRAVARVARGLVPEPIADA